METTCSLLKMGKRWQNATKYKEKVKENAKVFYRVLMETQEKEFTQNSEFVKGMNDICKDTEAEYKQKLIHILQEFPENFDNTHIKRLKENIPNNKNLNAVCENFEKKQSTLVEKFIEDKLQQGSFQKMCAMYDFDGSDPFKHARYFVLALVSLPVAKVVMAGLLLNFLWNEYQKSRTMTKSRYCQVLLSQFKRQTNEKINNLIENLRCKSQEMERIVSVSLAKGIQDKEMPFYGPMPEGGGDTFPTTTVSKELEKLISELWDVYVKDIIKHEIEISDIEQEERICRNVYTAHLKTDPSKKLAMKQIEDRTRAGQTESGDDSTKSLPSNSQIYREVVLLRYCKLLYFCQYQFSSNGEKRRFRQYVNSSFEHYQNIVCNKVTFATSYVLAQLIDRCDYLFDLSIITHN